VKNIINAINNGANGQNEKEQNTIAKEAVKE